MKKKDLWVLSTILAIPLIVGFILALIFNFRLEKSEWITLVTSCVSTFAAIFLGFMVFFQNENHKKRSEDMAKEREKQEQLYRDEEQKNRDQDLIVKANPSVYFNKVESIHISLSSFIVGQQSHVNRLMDEKPCKDISCYDCNVYCELVFNKINNSIVDKIHIKKAKLLCYVSEFPSDEYKVLYEKDYKNFILERDKANIKIVTNDEIISHLSLLSCQTKEVEKDDVLSLDDEYKDRNALLTAFQTQSARGCLNIYYTVSNVFGVAISYKTQISFAINNCIYDESYDYSIVIGSQNICTWQTDKIHKEKANESDT